MCKSRRQSDDQNEQGDARAEQRPQESLPAQSRILTVGREGRIEFDFERSGEVGGLRGSSILFTIRSCPVRSDACVFPFGDLCLVNYGRFLVRSRCRHYGSMGLNCEDEIHLITHKLNGK